MAAGGGMRNYHQSSNGTPHQPTRHRSSLLSSGGGGGVSTTTGASQSTALGDVVQISVPLIGPYGILLESDEIGKSAVIKAWDRLPDGKIGPIQKHGGVRIGDVLLAINDTPLHDLAFPQVMRLLRSDNLLKKTLHFGPKEEVVRRRTLRSNSGSGSGLYSSLSGSGGGGGAQIKGSTFMSQVRRARVNEQGKSYAEYEIACFFRTIALQQLQKEKAYRWSVWRRYSEFEGLDSTLRQVLGWQLQGIVFPTKHSLVFNKLSKEFLESRRRELDGYWQKVLGVDRVTDFTKHHCSQELKGFLDVNSYLSSSTAAGGGGRGGGDGIEQELMDEINLSHTSNGGMNGSGSIDLSNSGGGGGVGGGNMPLFSPTLSLSSSNSGSGSRPPKVGTVRRQPSLQRARSLRAARNEAMQQQQQASNGGGPSPSPQSLISPPGLPSSSSNNSSTSFRRSSSSPPPSTSASAASSSSAYHSRQQPSPPPPPPPPPPLPTRAPSHPPVLLSTSLKPNNSTSSTFPRPPFPPPPPPSSAPIPPPMANNPARRNLLADIQKRRKD